MELREREFGLNSAASIEDWIGRDIINSYGWRIGKIIGFFTDSGEKGSAFGVELNNGGFITLKASKVHLDQDTAKIDDSWRNKAEKLANEIALIVKKVHALDELKGDVEVSKKVWNELCARFEGNKNALLDRRRHFKEQLKERMSEIESRLKSIYEFSTYLKIDYHMGDLDENSYQKAYISTQVMIDKLLSEEEDIKLALNTVTSNLLTLPPEPLQSLPPSDPQSPPIKLRIEDKEDL